MMKTNIKTEDKIITIINRIRRFYFVMICLGALDVIFNLSGISEGLPRREILQAIMDLFLYLIIYIGLKQRKGWLIPLILLSSAWWLISTFLTAFQPAVDAPGLLAKAGGILLVLFFSYQLRFFSRREVKSYFDTREIILF